MSHTGKTWPWQSRRSYYDKTQCEFVEIDGEIEIFVEETFSIRFLMLKYYDILPVLCKMFIHMHFETYYHV